MTPFEDEPFQLDCYVEALLASGGRASVGVQAGSGGHITADPVATPGRRAAPDAELTDVDPELARAAATLSRLLRFHPSFRFEEELSARLAVAAAAMTSGLVPQGRPPVLSLARRRPAAAGTSAGSSDAAGPLGPIDVPADADPMTRPAVPAVPAAPRSIPARLRLAAEPLALPVVALPVAADLGLLRAVGIANALGVDRLPAPVLLGGAIASGMSLAGAAFVGWQVAHRRARRPS